jgi:hypothetical protein
MDLKKERPSYFDGKRESREKEKGAKEESAGAVFHKLFFFV